MDGLFQSKTDHSSLPYPLSKHILAKLFISLSVEKNNKYTKEDIAPKVLKTLKEIYDKIKIDVFVLISKQNLNEIVAGEIIGTDAWVDFFWEHI